MTLKNARRWRKTWHNSLCHKPLTRLWRTFSTCKQQLMENNLTYTEAYNELQSIVKKMENADISVDELTKNIERALQLIRICKEKLGKTEEEVNKIMS